MINIEQIQRIAGGSIGAIAAAIIGSMLFRWQVKHWSWITPKVGKKERHLLLVGHKANLRIAKVLSVIGIGVGILFYATGFLNAYDWRGLGVGVGLMFALPIGYTLVANMSHGTEKIKEGMLAFAVAQKLSVRVLFALTVLAFIGGVLSAVSLFLRH